MLVCFKNLSRLVKKLNNLTRTMVGVFLNGPSLWSSLAVRGEHLATTVWVWSTSQLHSISQTKQQAKRHLCLTAHLFCYNSKEKVLPFNNNNTSSNTWMSQTNHFQHIRAHQWSNCAFLNMTYGETHAQSTQKQSTTTNWILKQILTSRQNEYVMKQNKQTTKIDTNKD